MPYRTVLNVNNSEFLVGGRLTRLQANEIVNATGTTAVENNTNIIGAVVTAGNAIVYTCREFRASGTAQYDLNAV